jgi:site-specific recombinase XerD
VRLSPFVHQFFDHYLTHIKGVSPYTIEAYRDTFRLFLPFAANYYRIKVKSLRVEHLSSKVIIAFLSELQKGRKNRAKTCNQRLAAIKSFAKMVRLMHPDQRELADTILNIPLKRAQKTLIGFLYEDELLEVFQSVDLKRKEGFRDYVLLHLLYDSGARASEISTLNLDCFNPHHETLVILGKGNRYRLIGLEHKTVQLLNLYIKKYRANPKPLYQNRIFINQRREQLTRHGIYRICTKYLSKALPPKRLTHISPVHSFRHSRAVHMLYSGYPITDIKNRLGHDDIQSTTIYLHLDLTRKRNVQRKFIRYMQSVVSEDQKIDELLQWESKEDIMKWLDSL